MSLIVEDGTIVANAESFVSVADADAYHVARGNNTWALLSTAQKEEALRRATDFMQQTYRMRWKGYRRSALQVLDWPRSFVQLEPFVTGGIGAYPYLVADNIVPTEVKNACAALAIRAAAGDLNPDLERATSSVKVGDISVVYDPLSPERVRYSSIDAMLSPYIEGNSMNRPVARA